MKFQQLNRVETCSNVYLNGGIPSVSMGISGKCNLACLYCSEDAGKKNSKETTPADKISILNKLKASGLQSMAFCFYGEPFLDPAFWSMVEWCGKNNVLLYSFTNLTQVTNIDVAKKLLDNNVVIAGKMDRLTDFDDLLGVKGGSQRSLKGLEYLLEAGYPVVTKTADSIITNLSVVFVPTKLNYTEATNVAKKCRDMNVFLRVGGLEEAGRAVDNRVTLHLSKEELDRVYSDISKVYGYDYLDSYFDYCLGILGVMVDNDGSVFVDQYGLSCHFVMPRQCAPAEKDIIGNALDEPMENIWERIENKRAANVRSLEYLTKSEEDSQRRTVGCSGRTDKMLRMAVDLIKRKHRLT